MKITAIQYSNLLHDSLNTAKQGVHIMNADSRVREGLVCASGYVLCLKSLVMSSQWKVTGEIE